MSAFASVALPGLSISHSNSPDRVSPRCGMPVVCAYSCRTMPPNVRRLVVHNDLRDRRVNVHAGIPLDRFPQAVAGPAGVELAPSGLSVAWTLRMTERLGLGQVGAALLRRTSAAALRR